MLVFCMFLFWTKEVLGSVACNESCKEEILSSLTPIIESLVTETRTLKQEVQHLKLELEIQKKKNSVGSIGQKLVHDYSESGTRKRLLENTEQSNIVAFYAYMGTHEPIQKHKTLIFDVEKMDNGKGYNNDTGVFMAPTSGLYIFSFTIHSNSNSYGSYELVVNHEVLDAIFNDSSNNGEISGSTAVIPVWVNIGDVVYVRTHSTYDGTSGFVYSNIYARSSFAAWKVSN